VKVKARYPYSDISETLHGVVGVGDENGCGFDQNQTYKQSNDDDEDDNN